MAFVLESKTLIMLRRIDATLAIALLPYCPIALLPYCPI